MTIAPGHHRANRVSPFGERLAIPARGLLMGNRGNLHGPDGQISTRRWAGKLWISCRLEPIRPGYRAPFDNPRGYTPLFFADEAVAMAAGHRPCAECRRPAYNAFVAAWRRAFGIADDVRLPAHRIDTVLHEGRLEDRQPRRFRAPLSALPPSTFFTLDATPRLALRKDIDGATAWREGSYEPHPRIVEQEVTVLTPAPLVAVLAAGYAPIIARHRDDAPPHR